MQGLMFHRPGSYQQIVVRAKQSAYMPDRTILSIWGVGVRRGSDWQEIEGGITHLASYYMLLRQEYMQSA